MISRLSSVPFARSLFRRALCTATETRTQKLERITDELLDLNKLERYDCAILLRHRMGLNRYGAAASVSGLQSPSSAAGGLETSPSPAAATAAANNDYPCHPPKDW